MRCFISIDLPAEVKEEIKKIEKELQKIADETIAKIKLVKPENLHFTIKFLGELTESQVDKIKNVLSEIKFEPFKVKLNSVGVFPSSNYIRVIWVDVLPKEKLIDLQKKIDETLIRVGFRKNKTFETHITFSRIKYIKHKEKFVEHLRKLTVKSIKFEIKNFSFKKSTLMADGPIYEDILKFEF